MQVHVPKARGHVMCRSDGGAAIYRNDHDRRWFLGMVPALPENFGTVNHTIFIMDDEYNLLLRCGDTGLSHTL